MGEVDLKLDWQVVPIAFGGVNAAFERAKARKAPALRVDPAYKLQTRAKKFLEKVSVDYVELICFLKKYTHGAHFLVRHPYVLHQPMQSIIY